MIRIELRPEVEARLAADAEARGMALERYVAEKIEESVSGERRAFSVTDTVMRIRKLREGNRLDGLDINALTHEGHKY